MDRILRNTATSLRVTFYADETAADVDANAVAVSIVNDAGTTIASGSATRISTGLYAYTLPAQANLAALTTTWTATMGGLGVEIVTEQEVVGARLVALRELRAMDGLSDTQVFPTEALREAIEYAEETILDATGTMYVPRHARETHYGKREARLLLGNVFPSTLHSVTVDGVAETLTDYRLSDEGLLTAPAPFALDAEVVVVYDHGPARVPADIAWAARTIARWYLIEQVSRIPDRALSVQSDFGQIMLAQPGGKGRPTSLPEVNAVLMRHNHRGRIAF